MTAAALSSLDIAAGMVLPNTSSLRSRAPKRSGVTGPASPRAALEAAILPGLLRPPCLVSFSGGRDSAAVLAAATALARREGLALPIPATNIFSSDQDADESDFQELLVRHLGLTDWIRLEYTDELDLIGPYAQRVLKAHGLVWPANVHFHLPLLEAAQGGALLTGIGGDELFMAARRLRSAAVLTRAVRPRPRDALSLALAFAPRRLRTAVIGRRATLEAPWLRPAAKRRVIELLACEAAAEPRRLKERLAWWQQLRYLQVGTASLDLLGCDTNTLILHPLLAPPFWQAVATAWGPHGFAGRTEGTRVMFGDLLPDPLVARSSKTNFDKVFWTERARDFARRWDGSGVPLEWVEAGELARHWAGSNPSVPSSFLLQAAWLASG
jgi:asparagine synthase